MTVSAGSMLPEHFATNGAVGHELIAVGQERGDLDQMLDAKPGGSENLPDVAPGLLALGFKVLRHGAIWSFGHLAADEQQAAMLPQFKSHAVAAGGRVDRCGIVADDVSWGHRASPVCGVTVSGGSVAGAKHIRCGSAQENLLQGHGPSVSNCER